MIRPRTPRLETVAIVSISGMFLASLLLYVLTVNQEARLNAVQLEIRRVRETNVRLRAELARRQAPDVLEGRATKELGMGKPNEVVFAPSAESIPQPTSKISRLVPSGVAEGY